MATTTGQAEQHPTLDLHDDRYGNPVETLVGERIASTSTIHEKNHDAPAHVLEKGSSHSNDVYSQEKTGPETSDPEQAQNDSSQFRRMGRRLRPNKLVLSVSCWLLVTT